MGRLANVRRRSYQFLHIGHRDHPDTPLFTLGTPPLLLWLVQDDKDLPFLEGKVLCITASEVKQSPHILHVLLRATHGLDGTTHCAWVP